MRHVLHDALVLLFNHGCTIALSCHRVFDDCLSFELFRPSRKLVIHRRLR